MIDIILLTHKIFFKFWTLLAGYFFNSTYMLVDLYASIYGSLFQENFSIISFKTDLASHKFVSCLGEQKKIWQNFVAPRLLESLCF
jgi:hypothetical protein